MRVLHTFPLLFMAAIAATPASAQTVFSDDFSSDAPQKIPATDLNNFTVTGTVDVVASGNFDITCAGGSGYCIDIDGSPGPGALTSKATFSYNAGDTVTLFFDLSGNQRTQDTDVFIASLLGTGVTASQTYNLAGSDPFTTRSLSFLATQAGSASFSFSSPSADNVGPLLDNVRLEIGAVPEPGAWAMLILGFGVIGSSLRRRANVSRLAHA